LMVFALDSMAILLMSNALKGKCSIIKWIAEQKREKHDH